MLAAFGQKIGDTVEEEGIAYSISYVAADVAIQILLSRGLGEVKNVSKADELADVARTVDTLDDTVKIADELTDAAKVVDQVGDIADAAMAVNVMDEANAVVKAVDNVDDIIEGGKAVSFTQKNVGAPILPEGSQWERNVLNSFAGGKATQTTYEGGTVLYRVGGKNGGFWSLEVPPMTEYQWRVDYAIKQEFCNDATTLYKMTIPEGSSLIALEGKVGTQGMGLYGGAHQAYIDYRAVPTDWIEITVTTWK